MCGILDADPQGFMYVFQSCFLCVFCMSDSDHFVSTVLAKVR
jgi:hypothetical protein